MQAKGQLVVVGTGMMLGAHLTPRSRAFLADADLVFVAVTDALTEQWIATINPKVQSFSHLYQEGKSRKDTYQQMTDLIVGAVQAGQKVVAAFYGHPGVFAQVARQALVQVKALGCAGQMEPGVSAADCLHADLQLDPATYGCMYIEASQLMFYQRQLDTAGYVIVWQIALAGDLSLSQLHSQPALIALFVEHLLQWYPPDHSVILYEAASLPFQPVRREQLALAQLPSATLNLTTTLVIPPAAALQTNTALVARIKQLTEGQA